MKSLLEDLRRGRGDGPDILSSIWETLPTSEQILLRFMAEALRPETEKTIEKFVASKLNHHKFRRAMRMLVSLNLIVVKRERSAPDLYDLHPLVRQFVRGRYERNERQGFVKVVLKQYDLIIGRISAILSAGLPYPLLERYTQKAELQTNAGFYEEAFETLEEIEDALVGGGYAEEFLRVARTLLEAVDWETAPTQFKLFDSIVGSTVEILNQLEDFDGADEMLARYELTIPVKTARYINFCNIKTYAHWMRKEFNKAIEIGKEGVRLKEDTNVDTHYDCKHNLALAQRDAGFPDIALEYFQKEHSLSELTDPDNDAGTEDGVVHGNVGRCLQLKSDNDGALVCYKKSIKALENDGTSQKVSNRAYARQWIGEVLEQNGDLESAAAFYTDALRLLGSAYPSRSREIQIKLSGMEPNAGASVSQYKAKEVVKRWTRS